MRLLDTLKLIIKRIIKKNKLLGDGSRRTQNDEKFSKETEFKRRITKKSLENLTPEQWQLRFLEKNNFGKCIKNPYVVKFLTLIPAIAEIKDKESFENAQNYNYSVIPKELRFSFDDPCIYLDNDGDSILISLSPNDNTSSYAISVLKSREFNTENEQRVYDSKSGIEIERYKEEYRT